MSENSSINTIPQGISEERLRTQIEPAVRKQMRELLSSAPVGTDKKVFILEKVAAAKSFFEGGEDLLETFLDTMRNTQPESDEILEETASRAMTDAVVKLGLRVPLDELLRRFREKENEALEATILDKSGMFTSTKYENTVEMHIKSFGLEDIPNSGKVPLLRERFLEATARLAEIVHADQSIERVELTSWIVAKYRRIIEKELGFTIVELSEEESEEIEKHLTAGLKGKRIGRAIMTREDFLKKYGA